MRLFQHGANIGVLWSDQHADFIRSTAVPEQSDPNIYHHNQYYDDNGVAVWRGITDAVGRLANRTPAGPLH